MDLFCGLIYDLCRRMSHVHLRKSILFFWSGKFYICSNLIFCYWFCLVVNSISESGILKSPTIAELFISPFNYFSFLLHIFWSSIVSSYFSIHLPGLYISVKFINAGIGHVLTYMEINILGFWYLISITVFMISSYTSCLWLHMICLY